MDDENGALSRAGARTTLRGVTSHEPKERGVPDLSGRHRRAPSHRHPAEASEPTQEDIKTLRFALYQQNAEAFLTDETRGRRDNPEAWSRATSAMSEGKLEPQAVDQLALDIGKLAVSAKQEIAGNRHLNQATMYNPQLASASDYAKEQVDYQAAKLILQHSDLYPPPALAEEGSERQQLWMAAVNDRIRELAVTDRHHEIPDFLREARNCQERYHVTGIEPGGHLDLDRYLSRYRQEQEQAMADHQPGFNPVHTTAFAPEATPREAVAYVRERMSEMMDDAKAVQVGPTTFAKAFVDPYLDHNLSSSFAHYDLSDQAYLQGHVIETGQKSLLHGPTDDPQVHLEATYNRVMRNAIAKIGIAEAASRHDAAEFAIGVIKTSNLANDMKEWLDTAANHWVTDPTTPRRDPGTYEPALEWQQPKESQWRRVATETNDFTDPRPLLAQAHRMEQMIMGPMAGAYGPVEPGSAYAKTLTEALRDIADAQFNLGTIVHEADMDKKQREAADYLAANANLTDTDPSPAVQNFILAYTQAANQTQLDRERDAVLFRDRAAELRQELTGAGFSGEDAERFTSGPGAKTMALYDRSIQLLSHADFNLSYIHHQRH